MAKKRISKLPEIAKAKRNEVDEFRSQLTALGRMRFDALMDELKNGKGIARIQASQEIARMEKEVNGMAEGVEIDVNFDAIATHEAESA